MVRLLSRVYNKVSRFLQYVVFKFKYSKVPIVRPLLVGTYYSQDGQDLYLSSLLINYLSNNSDSWIVDVGCNHPRNYSNSLFFEKWFNCRVLAIDPLEEYSDLWARQRPAAIFVNTAIGSSSDFVILRVPSGERADNMYASVKGGAYKVEYGGDYVERTVKCSKLSEILKLHNISEVLLLSIDVEGLEADVVKSIDFEKCVVRCIVLENNSSNAYGDDDVREYLNDQNFIFYARIGHLDDVFIHRSMINGRQ